MTGKNRIIDLWPEERRHLRHRVHDRRGRCAGNLNPAERDSGREEYFYNDIREVEVGRYVSGHMMFVMDHNNSHGYVVIAGNPVWMVIYLNCKS
jgi:hypothetical protein